MKGRAKSIIYNVAKNIVDKRYIIFLTYLVIIIFCIFSVSWVKVEENIVNYLPEGSKTRQGLIIMEDEFTTFGTAEIMISNISFSHGEKIAKKIERVNGVSSVMFDNTTSHYNNTSALFVVLFTDEANAPITLEAMDNIIKIIKPYDYSISTTVGVNEATELRKDMVIIGILAVIVLIFVLLFSSKSYIEIPIFLIVIGVSALLNMGTNFILGKISFVSHSVAVVLQMALSIDYAIILSHRFNEERKNLFPRDAAIEALTKSIPEVISSSMTTVGGLFAMAFMNFGIGFDLSMVMIKGIFLSMLVIFTLLPGLLVLFSHLIDKTTHKSFMFSISAIGRFSIKTRYIMPPIFLALLIFGFVFSNKIPYLFSLNEIRPFRLNESQKQMDRITETFGKRNIMILMVPSGDYKKEKSLLKKISEYDEVEMVIGLSNTEAIGGYMLTDPLTPREFSELVDIDYEICKVLYSAYAINDEKYANIISGIDNYAVPLIDMYEFLYNQVSQGFIPLDDELIQELGKYNLQLSSARLQMEAENYSRIFIYFNLPIESKETFDFISEIYNDAGKYYDSVYLLGESSSAMELSETFKKDNLIISILSVLFVIIVLMFTFRSFGLAILLIAVIQTSIWVNFSFPYLRNQGLYFLGFLVVSSIQMGANIDYAIVITNRYLSLKKEMKSRDAVVKALEQGFPTVITSGSIMAVAGYLIGFISTDGATSILGRYIGQGTIISIMLVLFVLPQLLYLGDIIIEKTSFKFNIPTLDSDISTGNIEVKGRVKGYVKGEVDAFMEGIIKGKLRSYRENSSEIDYKKTEKKGVDEV